MHYSYFFIHLYYASFFTDGFLLVTKECEWPNLFGQYYMGIDISDDDEREKESPKEDGNTDDMLFYVQSKPGGDVGQEVSCFFFPGLHFARFKLFTQVKISRLILLLASFYVKQY